MLAAEQKHWNKQKRDKEPPHNRTEAARTKQNKIHNTTSGRGQEHRAQKQRNRGSCQKSSSFELKVANEAYTKRAT
jgi:hypothetical protein